jgi:hypothetical protein
VTSCSSGTSGPPSFIFVPSLLILPPLHIGICPTSEATIRFSCFVPSYWTERRTPTYEEIICRGVSYVGPIVAIGQPGELLPKLGAARKYVTHSLWREEVGRLLRECQLACLMIGTSKGLVWEFEEVISKRGASKVLLIVPQGVEYGAIWQEFVRAIAARGLAELLPRRLPERALGVHISENGRPVVFVGEPTVAAFRAIAAKACAAR